MTSQQGFTIYVCPQCGSYRTPDGSEAEYGPPECDHGLLFGTTPDGGGEVEMRAVRVVEVPRPLWTDLPESEQGKATVTEEHIREQIKDDILMPFYKGALNLNEAADRCLEAARQVDPHYDPQALTNALNARRAGSDQGRAG